MFQRTVVATPSERMSADLLHAARGHIRSESAPSLATLADSLSFDDWESLQSYLTFLSWASHSWLQPTWADHRKGKHKNRAATLHVFLSQAKLGRDQLPNVHQARVVLQCRGVNRNSQTLEETHLGLGRKAVSWIYNTLQRYYQTPGLTQSMILQCWRSVGLISSLITSPSTLSLGSSKTLCYPSSNINLLTLSYLILWCSSETPLSVDRLRGHTHLFYMRYPIICSQGILPLPPVHTSILKVTFLSPLEDCANIL